MNALLEKHLIKTYPKIFRDMYGDPKKTCMAWGCSCGDGWFFLLNQLCSSIQHHIDQREEAIKGGYNYNKEEAIPQVVFSQVKEKFGALRIYSEGGDDYIRAMINFTEAMSHWVCENCGKHNEDVGRTTGWIQALCSDCATDYKKKIRQRRELVSLWKKVVKSRKNPKRAWKGQDEPFSKDDFIPPYVKNKPKKARKGKK